MTNSPLLENSQGDVVPQELERLRLFNNEYTNNNLIEHISLHSRHQDPIGITQINQTNQLKLNSHVNIETNTTFQNCHQFFLIINVKVVSS